MKYHESRDYIYSVSHLILPPQITYKLSPEKMFETKVARYQ